MISLLKKRGLPVFCGALLTILPSISQTHAQDQFLERLQIEGDSPTSRLLTIKNVGFNVAPDIVIENLIEAILQELIFVQSASITSLEQELAEMDYDSWPKSAKNRSQYSLEALSDYDITAVVNDSSFMDFLSGFKDKLRDHLKGFRVVAHLDDPRYFYSRKIAKKAASLGINLAKSIIETEPILAFAVFISNQVGNLIAARRAFFQNYVLHYLEKFEAGELSLGVQEVSRIRSSIFESGISWFAFWESRNAKNNWESYGNEAFAGLFDFGSAILSRNALLYDSIGERENFAFNVASDDDEKKLVNLVNTRHMLSLKPSTAFYFDRPTKVRNQRRLLRLIQLGSRLIPAPGFVRDIFDNFMESMYLPQSYREGALFALFESDERYHEGDSIIDQSLNPFLRMTVNSQ